MFPMRLTLATLKAISDNLKIKITENYISNISVLGNNDFLVSFSKFRHKRLLISFSHQAPFLALVNNETSFPTTASKLNEVLRKEIKDSCLEDITLINEDRILAFHIIKSNDVFERVKKTLILEFIPTKPNLIILGEDNKVIFALHEGSLESPRPLMRGLGYEPPRKKNDFKPINHEDIPFDYESYAEEKLTEAHHHQIRDRFSPLFHFLKTRIKALAKKGIVLAKEIEDARKDLVFLDHGNTLLSLAGDKEQIELYVKDNNLPYDPRLGIGANANRYFKKYKKAKRTILMDEEEIQKAKQEIARLEIMSGQTQYMDEGELLELAKLEMPHLFKNKIIKINREKPSISFVLYENCKIFFGKNAKQNDYITFKLANRLDWFFHIKDYPGSHVVISSSRPSDEQILRAAEMCLVLSNKTAGEVQTAQVKDVKKTSKVGQVILNKYQSLKIDNIDEETLKLLENYRKIPIAS